jgi:hypothetical protein
MVYKIKNKIDTGFGKPIWSIKDYKKARERKTYDVYLNGEPNLNFETKEEAEFWIKKAKEENYFSMANNPKVEIKERISKPYKLGEGWREDFDYTGMIKTGAKADRSWSDEDLNKLFDSYEDVNYHTPSKPLFSAIQNRKKGKYAQAEKDLAEFRKRNDKLLKEWGE